MGKRSCNHFITFLLRCFFLHILLPCSSVGSLPQIQFFKNYSNMYPFCRVLQEPVWFPHRSQFLTATCCGIGSIQPPSGYVHLLCHWDRLQGRSLLPHVPLWAARGKSASAWSSPQAAAKHCLLLTLVSAELFL